VLYRHKHPAWWLQSFLAGVATMVLGGRNHVGQLQKVTVNFQYSNFWVQNFAGVSYEGCVRLSTMYGWAV
jgi:hypothetical protein